MRFVPTLLRRTVHSLPRSCSARMSAPQPTEPTTTVAPTPPPWHAAYPAPRNAEPLGATREEVLAMLKAQLKDQNSSCPRDFVLVDLRRTDHEVRHIPPSLRSTACCEAGVHRCHFNSDTPINRAAPFAGPSICRRRACGRLSRRCILS